MADEDIAPAAIDKRSHRSVPRPLKRWRVLVVGRAATALIRESPSDQRATSVPDRRLTVSEPTNRKTAHAD